MVQGFCTVDPALWSDMQKQLQDLKEEQDRDRERRIGLRFASTGHAYMLLSNLLELKASLNVLSTVATHI